LNPDEYGEISVSWIGFNYWSPRGDLLSREKWPGANVRIQAQVRTKIDCASIWDKARHLADDYFEHDRCVPIDWDRANVLEIINSVVEGRPDRSDRIWTPFSALAAQELYRLRRDI